MWKQTSFVDQRFWVKKTELLAHDLATGHHPLPVKTYPAHPGMPPLLVAAGASVFFKVPVEEGLRMSVTLLNALIISGIAAITKRIGPQSWWWISGTGLALLYSHYDNVNPLDAVTIPLITLVAVLLLWHYQQRARTPLLATLALGLAVGFTAATRLHMAILIVAPLLAVSVRVLSRSQLLIIAGSALAWLQALNPIMWYAPLAYLREALFPYTHYFTGGVPSESSYQFSVSEMPLGIIAALLALVFYGIPSLPSPLPRRYLFGLFASTACPLIIFQLSSVQDIRYFLPIIFLWEFFLPLFVFHLLHYAPLPSLSFNNVSYHLSRRWLSASFLMLFLGGHAFALWISFTAVGL